MSSCINQKDDIEIEDMYSIKSIFNLDEIFPDQNIKEKVENFLDDLIKSDPTDDVDFSKKSHMCRRKYKITPKKNQLLCLYRIKCLEEKIKINPRLETLITTKLCRGWHGVIVVSVIMGPGQFSCSERCSFCPTFPGLAKSYIPDEPTVERGKRNNFSGYLQTRERLNGLFLNGHNLDKLEIIILGGTFSCYPKKYSEEFIRDIYWAANTIFDKDLREPKSLQEERLINETTFCKIIGVTLETRPDFINHHEIRRFRSYGATRVQIGAQSTNDAVLEYNKRNSTNQDTKNAIQELLDAGFKVDIHIMPDLPSSTLEIDQKSLNDVLYDSDLYADQYKIYPTMITDYTEIKEWAEKGIYKSMYEKDPELLIQLGIDFKSKIQRSKRINRFIRDFSNTQIIGGTSITNMRQVITDRMHQKGLRCMCIRCREVNDKMSKNDTVRFRVLHQVAAGQKELFLSYEDCTCSICYWYWIHILIVCPIITILYLISILILWPTNIPNLIWEQIYWKGCGNESKLYGFLRLRLSENCGLSLKRGKDNIKIIAPELRNCSLLRELHVYGKVIPTYNKDNSEVQHSGYGAKLVNTAVNIAKLNGFTKMSVISGDGVKEYYRKKFNFQNEGQHGYLIKHF